MGGNAIDKARLILLRHAKSDWDSGARSDFDRPLAERGRRDAPRMGRWLKESGFIPELILCSPALRTRETLAAVNDHLQVAEQNIVYEDAIYGASLGALRGLVEKRGKPGGALMLIGHNPGISELLGFLCATSPGSTAAGKIMTTATAAVLEFETPGLMAAAGAGELLSLMRPRELPEDF